MDSAKITSIVLTFFLITICDQGMAMNIQVHPSVKTTDSLYLPPLTKFIGKELDSLLIEINPNNYDKFYIDASQGIPAGVIIQFIDDDQICNFLNTKILERMGFVNDIRIALNGKQAIDLFREYYIGIKPLPDIILLDLNMPVMDGFGFLDAFKSLNLQGKHSVK